MNIAEAQKEIRFHYAGGFYGQLVSSVLWAISASFAAFASPTIAIATLVLGGFLIFSVHGVTYASQSSSSDKQDERAERTRHADRLCPPDFHVVTFPCDPIQRLFVLSRDDDIARCSLHSFRFFYMACESTRGSPLCLQAVGYLSP